MNLAQKEVPGKSCEKHAPSGSLTDQASLPAMKSRLRQSSEIEMVESCSCLVDSQGNDHVFTVLPPPQIRCSSPTLSDSSDEVIIFAGRDHTGRVINKPLPVRTRTEDPYGARTRIHVDEFQKQNISIDASTASRPHLLLGGQEKDLRPAALSVNVECEEGLYDQHCTSETLAEGSKASANTCYSYKRIARRPDGSMRRADKEVVMDDYISNIEAEQPIAHSFHNLRDLGGTDSDLWQEVDALAVHPLDMLPGNPPNRSEQSDSENESIHDGLFGTVRKILSKRRRKGGLQYLIVWEDNSAHETRWVPISILTDINSKILIDRFEAKEKLVAELSDKDGDSDLVIEYHGDGHKHTDLSKVEQDSGQEKAGCMTDEEIARLLAKQEKLGIGSAALMLFDDSAGAYVDGIVTGTGSPSRKGHQDVRSSPRSKRPRIELLSAHTLADAYDVFDVLDFERPSLKKKPKGRKAQLRNNLSDSDFDASMQISWENDRIRKKERNEKRQELRAQGLLGSRRKKPDLKEKYKEGMGFNAVKEEIRNFLLGDNIT